MRRYLLVHGRKSHKWGFPKGHMELGETEKETALREFREETGIDLKIPLEKKLRFKNNIYFVVGIRHYEIPSNLSIYDTNEIEIVQWFHEHDILNLEIDRCNFGLKNWINQTLRPKLTIRSYHQKVMV